MSRRTAFRNGLFLAALACGPRLLASSDPPPEDPERFARIIAAADERISSRNRAETETPHFLVVTDVFTEGTLQDLASSLEGAYFTIHEVLGIPTKPSGRKVRVYFFEHAAQHYGFAGASRGVYVPPGLLAFYKGRTDTQTLVDILVHEATHAFLDQFVIAPEVRFPIWLNEGFAAYMGRSLLHEGRILPGIFYARQRQDFLNRSVVVRPAANESAKRIVLRLKLGPMLSLDELTSADACTFYGRDSRDHYDLAWAFVHYLRHARPEGGKGFSALVAAIARGTETESAFTEVYGVSPASMETEFHHYVRGVLAKPKDPPPEFLDANRR